MHPFLPALVCLDLVLLCSAARAASLQVEDAPRIDISSTDAALARVRNLTPEAGLELPLFDEPGDGALWVRGKGYKARFDTQGLEFIPFLGADAPQDYPIRFSIESARVGESELSWSSDVAAEREGALVRYRRGAFDEVFEVGADSIEHSFVLDRRVSGGDLVIRIQTEGELRRASSARGTEFTNERGGVHYGRATVSDARGERIASSTRLDGDSIEIRTPALELERAEFPLVVDPVVWAFTISDTTSIHQVLNADVSYDLTSNTWLCVYEDVYSFNDHDIVARQLDDSGNVVPGGTTYIDYTSADWQTPRVANNNAQNQFMVVARQRNPACIKARTRSATSTTMSGQFAVAAGLSWFYDFPDIGGDSYAYGTPAYCVIWQEMKSDNMGVRYSIGYRLVSPSGTLLQTGYVNQDLTMGAPMPSISKSNGTRVFGNSRWTVAWNNGAGVTCNQIDLAGNFPGYFNVGALTEQTERPSVSPLFDEFATDRRFLLAVIHSNKATWSQGAVECFIAAPNQPKTTFWWTDVNSGGRQDHAPRAEYDGTRMLVSYHEDMTPTNQDVFVSTFWLQESSVLGWGATPELVEDHIQMAMSGLSESRASIASKHTSGSANTYCMSVWDRAADVGYPAIIGGWKLYSY
jgi:hypothetical protein